MARYAGKHERRTRRVSHGSRRRVTAAAVVVCAILVALLSTLPAAAAAFRAAASVGSHAQFLGDATGTTFVFNVENTGKRTSIGAVRITRPSSVWTVIGCSLRPKNDPVTSTWEVVRSSTACRFLSSDGPRDDLAPGEVNGTFRVRVTTRAGSADQTATWGIVVSKTDRLNDPDTVRAAFGQPPGLKITAYSWKILDAVVAASPPPAGSPCPSSSHEALAGSTQTIVICGENRTNVTLTPSAARASLEGTFVTDHGTFVTGPIPPSDGSSVVLGSWTDVAVADAAGSRNRNVGATSIGNTIVASIGSASDQTSPSTTLEGYSTLNNPPVANDVNTVTQQGTARPITLSATDVDGDATTFTVDAGPSHGVLGALSVPTCSGTVPKNCSVTVVYVPAAGFAGPSDSFTYHANDGSADSELARVSIVITSPGGGGPPPPTNHPPVVTPAAFAVDENSPNGTAVGTVAFTDPDSGQTHAFSITGGNVGGAFTINGSTGQITVATSSQLDFETHPTFSLTVQVDDDGSPPLSDDATITIDLNNVNEPPVNTVPAGTVTAEKDTDIAITGISVADPDAGSDDVSVTLSALHGTLTVDTTVSSGVVTADVTGNGTAAVTLTASLAEIDATLADPSGLIYHSTPPYIGSDTLAVLTDDLGHNGSGGSATDTDTVALDVVPPINHAPVNTVPGPQSVAENTNLAFSSVGGDAILIADPDAGGSDVEVSLTATNGTMTLASISGLSFTVGDGTDDGAMTFTGTIANINIALDGMTWKGTFGFTGAGGLQIVTDDQGNTGSGGPLTDTDTVDITVTAPNGPPVNTVPAGTVNAPQDADVAITGISIADPDAAGDDVSVTLSVLHGTLSVDTGVAGGVGPGAATGNGTASVTLTASLAKIDATLADASGLIYHSAPPSYAGSDTLTVLSDDLGHNGTGGAATDTDTVDIDVIAPNQPPVNSVPGAQAVDEDTALTFSSGNGNVISISDPDAGSSDVEMTLSATNGTMTLSTIVSLIFTVGDGTDDAAMTFTGTIANINTALSGMTWKGTSNFNGSGNLQIITDDQGNTGTGGPLTDTDNVAITVNAVNDPPVAAPHSYDAQANMKISLGGLLAGVTDPDGSTFTVGTTSVTSPAGGTVTVTDASLGTFDFEPPPGVTGDVTFTYTACDDGSPLPSACGAPATVTVTVAGPVIWFVDATNGNDGTGTGALDSPFKTLAKAATVDAAGHRIFLYSGTYASGIALNADEWLVGQGVTGASFDAVFAITPPSGTIARPSVGGSRPIVQGLVSMGGSSDAVRGLDIQPGSGTQGLTATGGTSLTVGEVSVTTSNATAVSLTGGSSGTFSFTSISANGGASGIVLNNANASTGSFTVTGTGGVGSGGTIQNMTDSGILGTTTANLHLSFMNITNNGNAVNEGGIRLTELHGTNTITSSTISGGFEDNVFVENTAGVLTGLTIQNCSILDNNSSQGNTGITVLAATTAVMTVTVDGCTFHGNRTDAIHVDAGDTATLTATIQNNVITAGSPNQGNIGIDVTAALTAHVTFDVDANKVGTDGVTPAPLLNTGINVFAGNSSVMSGHVTNNTVRNAGAGQSGFGIRVFLSNTATIVSDVQDNTVSNVGFDFGILAESSGTVSAPGSGARMDVTVKNNNVSVLSGALDAIRVQARNFNTVCAAISGNTTNSGGSGFFGLFVRQVNSAIFLLDGFGGGVAPAATTYLTGQNPSAATVSETGTISSATTGTCLVPA